MSLDQQIVDAVKRYLSSGIEEQVDYDKFYLYSIITHSTAIEGSTVTEIENRMLLDEGVSAKGRSIVEQMMNLDLRDAYSQAFALAQTQPIYTPAMLRKLASKVMWRTGSEYSTMGGGSTRQPATSASAMSVREWVGVVIWHTLRCLRRSMSFVKAQYIQALIDSCEHDDPRIIEDEMMRQQIDNLNQRTDEYEKSINQ